MLSLYSCQCGSRTFCNASNKMRYCKACSKARFSFRLPIVEKIVESKTAQQFGLYPPKGWKPNWSNVVKNRR